MKPYTAFRKRLEFVIPFRADVLAAGAELLEAVDPDRVVVLADGGDSYAASMSQKLRGLPDVWCPLGGGVWCGIIARRRLVALFATDWPDLGRTVDALRAPQPPGRSWVFVLVVALGGCTLVQMSLEHAGAT